MKLLLDESIPRHLGTSFPDGFEVSTVQRMGWAGSKNGELLELAAAHDFDAFITADRGIEYQQNPDGLPLPVVVLLARRTRIQELQLLLPLVVDVLDGDLTNRFYSVAE